MADPIPFRRPIRWARLRADEAERVIRERCRDTANVFIGEHAFDRVEERTITTEDVYWILETGHVIDAPIKEGGKWKVIVARRMPGTREAGVVTLIAEDDGTLVVKTVQWMDWFR
jgi:Domain of unknown function (DUF4258)